MSHSRRYTLPLFKVCGHCEEPIPASQMVDHCCPQCQAHGHMNTPWYCPVCYEAADERVINTLDPPQTFDPCI